MNKAQKKDNFIDIIRLSFRALLRGIGHIDLNFYSLLSLRYFPRYLRNRREWLKCGGDITHTKVILSNYSDSAGAASGHYFHQDLLVASFIASRAPREHIDIGSRIDGFVAHVASFRSIGIVDIRPLPSTGHENIIFIQADLMNESSLPVVDSVSCLHAIEHFGLGRYTDPIDPNGHLRGFSNLLKILSKNGMLYISFPIGRENEIHFNAHRVFHPTDILSWPGSDLIKLRRFDYVDDSGNLHKNINLLKDNIDVRYGCGIYSFEKIV